MTGRHPVAGTAQHHVKLEVKVAHLGRQLLGTRQTLLGGGRHAPLEVQQPQTVQRRAPDMWQTQVMGGHKCTIQ